QIGAATAYIVIVHRNVDRAGASRRPSRARIRAAAVIGAQLTVRTGSLLFTFTVTTAIASRLGDVPVATHQISFQLWYFLALSLDAVAIAGQAIVGRSLGATDATGARTASRRMLQWGLALGVVFAVAILVTDPLLALAFTHDHAVRRELHAVLVAVALMQPI